MKHVVEGKRTVEVEGAYRITNTNGLITLQDGANTLLFAAPLENVNHIEWTRGEVG